MEQPKKFNPRVSSAVRIFAALAVVLGGLVMTIAFFDAIKIVFLGSAGPLLILVGLVMVAVAKE